MSKRRKFGIGAQVIVLVQPNPGHWREAYLPGFVVAYLGFYDPYDGRIEGTPSQHHYTVDLKEGGSVAQSENLILRNPQARK